MKTERETAEAAKKREIICVSSLFWVTISPPFSPRLLPRRPFCNDTLPFPLPASDKSYFTVSLPAWERTGDKRRRAPSTIARRPSRGGGEGGRQRRTEPPSVRRFILSPPAERKSILLSLLDYTHEFGGFVGSPFPLSGDRNFGPPAAARRSNTIQFPLPEKPNK